MCMHNKLPRNMCRSEGTLREAWRPESIRRKPAISQGEIWLNQTCSRLREGDVKHTSARRNKHHPNADARHFIVDATFRSHWRFRNCLPSSGAHPGSESRRRCSILMLGCSTLPRKPVQGHDVAYISTLFLLHTPAHYYGRRAMCICRERCELTLAVPPAPHPRARHCSTAKAERSVAEPGLKPSGLRLGWSLQCLH